MAREKSWFVGSTKKTAGSDANTAAASGGRARWGDGGVAQLTNQLGAGASIGGIDPDRERDPPARATALVFPEVERATTARWSSDHPPPNFQRLFASIQRAEFPLGEHLRALNCDQQSPCRGEALLPPRDDKSSYVPAKSSTKEQFAKRVAELDITNDVAFRVLSRKTKPGEKAPRLVEMRKFWSALSEMADYWDTSADNYYFTKAPTDPSKPGHEMFTKEVKRYKGRRMGNGADMPDKFRADTVNAFVEGVISAFGCRVNPPHVAEPRFAPTMQINKLEQPVRLTSIVMRLPAELQKPGAFLEGPVMGVLERNTIDFGSSQSASKSQGLSNPQDIKISLRKSEHDLLREIATMLMIAQQRAREHKPTTQAEEAWYSTKPRWGGGQGSKLPALEEAEDEYGEIIDRMNEIIDRMNAVPETPEFKLLEAQRHGTAKKVNRARFMAKTWSTLKGRTPGMWSDKTKYMAIGKPPGSPYDGVSSAPTTKYWLD